MRVLNVQLKHIHGGNPQVCLDYSRVLKHAGNEVFVSIAGRGLFGRHRLKRIGLQYLSAVSTTQSMRYQPNTLALKAKCLGTRWPIVFLASAPKRTPI